MTRCKDEAGAGCSGMRLKADDASFAGRIEENRPSELESTSVDKTLCWQMIFSSCATATNVDDGTVSEISCLNGRPS